MRVGAGEKTARARAVTTITLAGGFERTLSLTCPSIVRVKSVLVLEGVREGGEEPSRGSTTRKQRAQHRIQRTNSGTAGF